MQDLDFDFIGFTYNGQHSINDLGIYRVSNGDRYEDNWLPTLQEKTASVEGMDGLYYFGTKVQQKQFNIPFAFQGLTEGQLRKLKQTFNGDGIHDLIFDEYPFKVYSAKVTGSATMKYICFEDKQGRVYNGDGTLQFTCYYPYAHTPKQVKNTGTFEKASVRYTKETEEDGTVFYRLVTEKVTTLPCELYCLTGDAISIGCPSNSSVLKKIVLNCKIGNKAFPTECTVITNNSTSFTIPPFLGTGKLTRIETIEFHYNERVEEGQLNNNTATVNIEFWPLIAYRGSVYEYAVGENGMAGFRANSDSVFGRALNYYSCIDYPTKHEWAEASGLPVWSYDRNNNIGDVPAQFILTTSSVVPKGSKFKVGTLEIETSQDCEKLNWDGKTGLVTGLVDGKRVAIPFLGNSCGMIPVGQVSYSGTAPNGTAISVVLDYDYWYY